MDNKFWTFIVTLHAIEESGEAVRYKLTDLSEEILGVYRRTVWAQGFQVKTGHNQWEIISPFRIATVTLELQDAKINKT